MVFEVELISFQSKNDLFGDDGVLKEELTKDGLLKFTQGDFADWFNSA